MKLTETTLASIMVAGRRPQGEQQHLCLDKGYDFPIVEELAHGFGYTLHLRHRGEEIDAKRNIPGYRARRWVVERSHSWLNRFRRLLIRWEKKAENYLAMLHFACACIVIRATTPSLSG